MGKYKTIKYSESLEQSLVAILLDLKVELYRLDDELIILAPDELLPDEFICAERVSLPGNSFGWWAKGLASKKIRKE